MGYELYRHVLDNAPPDLTMAERFVLAVIADDANDRTRKGWPDVDTIARRTGSTAEGVRKALQRLGARGYEVREPAGTDRNGKPIYAYRGRQVNYVVPTFSRRVAERVDAESSLSGKGTLTERVDDLSTLNTTKGGQISGKGWTQSPERVDSESTPSPQSPHKSSSARASDHSAKPDQPHTEDDDDTNLEQHNGERQAVAAEIARRIGVPIQRAQAVADEIAHRFAPRNLTGYVASMPGDRLRELLAEPAPEPKGDRCANNRVVAADGTCCPDHERGAA